MLQQLSEDTMKRFTMLAIVVGALSGLSGACTARVVAHPGYTVGAPPDHSYEPHGPF